MLPYAEFMRRFSHDEGLIPHEVVSATADCSSPKKAWHEYLGLTQAIVAARLNISQTAYAQMERATRPRKTTVALVAAALRITVEQLDF